MIGLGLKKLAKENGMNIDSGVAYGAYKGYAATFREGNGFKQIIFSTSFPDQEQMNGFMEALKQRNVTKDFRVQNISVAPNGVNIVFTDNPGTMAKIQAFLDWFMPLLEQYGAAGAQVCAECGQQIIDSGVWTLRDGAVAFHVHNACARKMQEEVEQHNAQKKEDATGSYLSGAAGALLGAVAGAIVWAIVLFLGYVAGIVGFLIGFLANKLYDVFKGKPGKGKIAILIVAILVGVVLGTFLGMILVQVPGLEEAPYEWYELPELVILVAITNAEYRAGVLGNLAMGVLFAALGSFGLLMREGKKQEDSKVKVLK